jgi:uncharacterized protein
MTLELRSYPATLELRDDGRTITGVAVPYNTEARVGPRLVEVFARGAFGTVDPATVPFTARHPRSGDELPIGASVELRDEPDGLHGAWYVSDTTLGNEVLALARDRVPLGLSIGFEPLPGGDAWNPARTRVERRAARLDHVAVVGRGAYPGARIAAVRSQGGEIPTLPLLTLARLRRP